MDALWASLRRELLLRVRRPSAAVHPVVYALLVVMLAAFAVGSEPKALQRVAPAVIYMAVLLSGFLALEELFRGDVDDGSLDQLLVSGASLTSVLYGKVLAHWLIHGGGIVLATPLMALMLYLDGALWPVLIASLALVSLGSSLIGLIAAALTARLKQGAMLLALIVLPLLVPLMVFGSGAVQLAQQGQAWHAPLLWIASEVILLLSLAPATAALALRSSSD